MRKGRTIDGIDARLILALNESPRESVVALAEQLRMSRNTVQARLTNLEEGGVLSPFATRLDPSALGYPMTAFITIRVTQQMLDEVGRSLEKIPEVIEVFGLSGSTDLLARVVARDAEDLYRIAGKVLGTPGIERTDTALVMRRMVPSRLDPLLERVIGS